MEPLRLAADWLGWNALRGANHLGCSGKREDAGFQAALKGWEPSCKSLDLLPQLRLRNYDGDQPQRDGTRIQEPPCTA